MKTASPYSVLSEYLLDRYQARTYRLTISGGKTCPTRDGTFGPKKGWGGCTFCDQYGSASFHSEVRKDLSLQNQLEAAATGIRNRFKAEKFIAYFQSYTTNHQEIAIYKKYYQEAIQFPGVVALAVATRPDCIPDDFLEMLMENLKYTDVILELGVQSFHEPTLEWFDRGHTAICAEEGIQRTKTFAEKAKAKGYTGKFDLIAHMILGSPLESEKARIQGALKLNTLGVNGVKIHHLHILKKTKLAREFEKNPFPLPSLSEYEMMVANFIRHLSPEIIIHRTHATAPRGDELIGPDWSHMRAFPSHKLRRTMLANGWSQGDLCGSQLTTSS